MSKVFLLGASKEIDRAKQVVEAGRLSKWRVTVMTGLQYLNALRRKDRAVIEEYTQIMYYFELVEIAHKPDTR
ncbi:MAG: hypothetical protein LBL58_18785 [Tannerellaceae bacterium]|jgi:hypothetical protein|nr:hypothetical protein [Tannerellaceae bacterium]